VRALPAADFAALLAFGSRSTFAALLAAFALVTSFRCLGIPVPFLGSRLPQWLPVVCREPHGVKNPFSPNGA